MWDGKRLIVFSSCFCFKYRNKGWKLINFKIWNMAREHLSNEYLQKKFKIRYHGKSPSAFFMWTFDHVLKNYIPLMTCGRIHHSLHVCTPILNACVHSTVWFIVLVLAPWLRINSTLLPEIPNMKYIHIPSLPLMCLNVNLRWQL